MPKQINKIFNKKDHWKDHWVGMPEFIQEDKQAIKRVVINFQTEEDIKLFNEITGLNITMETKGIFYPLKKSRRLEYRNE